MRRSRGLVVGWMPSSQRSTTLADRLGFDIALLGRVGFRRPWTAPVGYLVLAGRTAALIRRRRPAAIVVVAPPFVAALVAVPLGRLVGARVVVDIHSGALLDRRWGWSIPALAAACRHAAGAVVTLESLAARLRPRGIRVLVVRDPLPWTGATGTPATSTSVDAAADDRPGDDVVAVLGWGDDEPIEALVEAAAGRPWRLTLTGRPRRALDLPSNVELAGFLAADAYRARLAAADVVVVLTTRDETLLSGAWEAIALGRPLVVSATPSLEATFGAEIASAGPDPVSIATAIDTALGDRAAAAARTEAARDRFSRENDAALDALRALLAP